MDKMGDRSGREDSYHLSLVVEYRETLTNMPHEASVPLF